MLHLIALVLIAIINLLFAALIFYKGGKRKDNRFFLLSAAFISIWSIGDLLMLHSKNVAFADFGAFFFLIGPMLTTLLLVLFSLYFPDGKWTFSLRYLTPFLVVSGGWIIWVALQSKDILTIKSGEPENFILIHKSYFIIYSVYLIFHFITAFIILLLKLKNRNANERSQILYCFVGILLSSSLALLSNVSLPIFSGNTKFLWLGPLFTTFYVASTSYAIAKHKLFDLQAFIARFLAYAGSLALVSAVFGTVIFGLASGVLNLKLSIYQQIVLSVTTAFAALLFQRVKRFFDKATNKLFYQDAYDPQDLFDQLNRLLVSTLDLDKLLNHASKILVDNLKAQYCVFGLKETEYSPVRIVGSEKKNYTPDGIALLRKLTPHIRQRVIVTEELQAKHVQLKQILDQNDIVLLIRLTPNVSSTEPGLGYIVLGAKKSGNPYGAQDLRVLDTVANELIVAIQNAMHFEEIQNFNQTLQAQVNDATNKLRRTNERLKQLDETKDEFISMASHQLRTPLTSVKGYLSMVLEGDVGKLNKQQEQMLTQSFVSSQRMVYLISDLLNLSRLNTGKFVIESSPVDLREVVQMEMGQLTETAKARNITMSYKNPEALTELMLDETKIHQVVMNFMDNAIYYTPSGGHVDIELIETPTAVEYRVVDNGIGVPRDKQKHLFSKFYRAENARKARPDGTGLGLFMAKKVIAAQGGAIIFESVEGKGSTFGFRFSKAKHAVGAETKEPTVAVAKV